MGLVQKELAGSALDCNVHIISWSRYQGSPDTIPFLLNIYDRQSYVIKVDNIETEEFYPFVMADLSCNSSKFEAFTQGEAFTHFLPAERHRYVRISEVKKCSFLGNFTNILKEWSQGALELYSFLLIQVEEFSWSN